VVGRGNGGRSQLETLAAEQGRTLSQVTREVLDLIDKR
jgi:hypothetical protein